MGYSTDYDGGFEASIEIPSELVDDINAFANVDHRYDIGLPGIWCDFHIERNALEWNGSEKTYNAKEWIVYIMHRFLSPNGINLNGIMEWQGEDSEDWGTITICDNNIVIKSNSSSDEIIMWDSVKRTCKKTW